MAVVFCKCSFLFNFCLMLGVDLTAPAPQVHLRKRGDNARRSGRPGAGEARAGVGSGVTPLHSARRHRLLAAGNLSSGADTPH